jgi:hypothetical protein
MTHTIPLKDKVERKLTQKTDIRKDYLVSWIGLNMGLMLISTFVILKEILKVETLTPIYLISSIFRTRPVGQGDEYLLKFLIGKANPLSINSRSARHDRDVV